MSKAQKSDGKKSASKSSGSKSSVDKTTTDSGGHRHSTESRIIFKRGLPKKDMMESIKYLKTLISNDRGVSRLRQIKQYRRECLETIIAKIYAQINFLYGGSRLALFPENICPVSFLLSSFAEMPGSVLITERGFPDNIVWIIVSTLINHDNIFKFKMVDENESIVEKKLFHEREEGDRFKLKTFIWCKLDNTGGEHSAYANVPEDFETTEKVEHTEYRAELALNRELFTARSLTQHQNCFFPLERRIPLKYMGGWMGKVQISSPYVTSDWQEPGDKTVFSVKVGQEDTDSHSFAIDKPIEVVVGEIHEKYEHSRFLPDAIGCENLLSLILLIEHELVHVAYGIYDNEGNYGSGNQLATMEMWEDLLVPLPDEGGGAAPAKSVNKRKTKSDHPLIQGITDNNGHGLIFVEWLNLLFGHIGHLSPFDSISTDTVLVDETIRRFISTPVTHAMKREYDRVLQEIEDEELGGGGKRKIRRSRRKKTKRRKRKSKKKKTKKRKQRGGYSKKEKAGDEYAVWYDTTACSKNNIKMCQSRGDNVSNCPVEESNCVEYHPVSYKTSIGFTGIKVKIFNLGNPVKVNKGNILLNQDTPTGTYDMYYIYLDEHSKTGGSRWELKEIKNVSLISNGNGSFKLTYNRWDDDMKLQISNNKITVFWPENKKWDNDVNVGTFWLSKKTKIKKGGKKKRKTRRRRRKRRTKKAGFIRQSKINKGVEGCNKLKESNKINACRNIGGLENYKKQQSKKNFFKKLNLPHRPHFHRETKTERHNREMAQEQWDFGSFGKN